MVYVSQLWGFIAILNLDLVMPIQPAGGNARLWLSVFVRTGKECS